MTQYFARTGTNGAPKSLTTEDGYLEVTLTYSDNMDGHIETTTAFGCALKVKNLNQGGNALKNVSVKIDLDDNFVNWDLIFSYPMQNPIFNFGDIAAGEESETQSFYVTTTSENGRLMTKPGQFYINALPTYTVDAHEALQFEGAGNST